MIRSSRIVGSCEDEQPEHERQLMDLVLALLTELRDVSAASLAGLLERTGEAAADERNPLDGAGGGAEAALDREPGMLHAGPEHGHSVDRVVHLDARPREQQQEGEEHEIADDRGPALRRNVRIQLQVRGQPP